MNYNYPYQNPKINYNDPNYIHHSHHHGHASNICSRCSNQGYYLDPYGTRLDCTDHIYTTPSYISPQETAYRVHTKPENILSRTYHSIKDCVKCGGSGFVNSWKNPKQKYCIDCVRKNGYCPKCNNTGYKLKNGKPCNCGLY